MRNLLRHDRVMLVRPVVLDKVTDPGRSRLKLTAGALAYQDHVLTQRTRNQGKTREDRGGLGDA